jgi:hypothetical protein
VRIKWLKVALGDVVPFAKELPGADTQVKSLHGGVILRVPEFEGNAPSP